MKSEISEALADRIRQVAAKVGGKTELARKTGIPLSSLNENLRGRKLSVERLIAIGGAGGVSLEWLAMGQGEPRRPAEPAAAAAPDAAAQMRGPAGFAVIDAKRLATAIRVVEEELGRRGLVVPADKRANLAVALYLMVTVPDAPPDEVRRMLEKILL